MTLTSGKTLHTDKDFFVVGDVHGCLVELEELLTHWDRESEQLVFIGDYIDRGKDSYGVLKLVKSLVNAYGAWALKGNHEDMFLSIEDTSSERFFVENGGKKTYDSFPLNKESDKPKYVQIREDFPDIVGFMEGLPIYIDTDVFIFVHAGITPYKKDWKNYPEDCLWIRDSFHRGKTNDRRKIVFGHTPTMYLNDTGRSTVWVNDNKVGIDGGCVFGGQLHGVRFSANGTLNSIISVMASI